MKFDLLLLFDARVILLFKAHVELENSSLLSVWLLAELDDDGGEEESQRDEAIGDEEAGEDMVGDEFDTIIRLSSDSSCSSITFIWGLFEK